MGMFLVFGEGSVLNWNEVSHIGQNLDSDTSKSHPWTIVFKNNSTMTVSDKLHETILKGIPISSTVDLRE